MPLKILLAYLVHIGLNMSTIAWIENWLKDYKQRVKVNINALSKGLVEATRNSDRSDFNIFNYIDWGREYVN